MLTQERLKELLDYDPLTGIFSYRVDRGRFKAGTIVGCPSTNGHLQIHIDRKKYYAHRLAWLYTHGEWPSDGVDHIGRDPSDNRLENLRLATQAENGQNCKLSANNTSGVTGIRWDARRRKWSAYIKLMYKHISLGRYDSLFDAVCARKAAEIAMHPYRVV